MSRELIGPATLVVLLFGCGDVIKKAPDAPEGPDDAAVDGADDDAPPDSSIDGQPAAAPTITAMAPSWGSSAGGTNVKITGSGFTAAGLVVMFGSANATNVNVVSDTEVRVVTPAGPIAPISVKVTTSGGMATFGTQFRNLAPLYAADGRSLAGNLYAINPANGASTTIGAIGAPITGLALSPAGVLYGASTSVGGGPAQLVILDPYTANRTVIGSLVTSTNAVAGVNDIAFEGSRLLGWRNNQMAEINVLNGQVTLYTASVAGTGNGIASRSAGTLAFTPKAGNVQLYNVNTANGAAAAGATMNGPAQIIDSLTFVGGTMYGNFSTNLNNMPTSALYSIDPATGATLLKGALPPRIDAIEGIPTQPPLSIVAPDEPATGAAPEQPAAAGVDVAAVEPPAQNVVVGGRTAQVADVLALGDRTTVAIPALKPLARGARHVELVDPEGHTLSISLADATYALVANHRGELKLIAPATGNHKVFGPIAELRFAR